MTTLSSGGLVKSASGFVSRPGPPPPIEEINPFLKENRNTSELQPQKRTNTKVKKNK